MRAEATDNLHKKLLDSFENETIVIHISRHSIQSLTAEYIRNLFAKALLQTTQRY